MTYAITITRSELLFSGQTVRVQDAPVRVETEQEARDTIRPLLPAGVADLYLMPDALDPRLVIGEGGPLTIEIDYQA